jgi:PPM family protein phosphatase
MTVLRAAAETHTGYVRSTNQDLALVSGDLVAVADGMGGHLGGEVAARTAIEELLEAYLKQRTAEGLVSAARRANRAVWRKSRVDRKLHGMGTTLTAAALVLAGPDGGAGGAGGGGGGEEGGAEEGGAEEGGGDRRRHLVLVNVGDSRAYVLDRSTQRLRQLTDDHSVVEEMVRQGELTSEEASVHPHRHVLTRALGIEAEVTLDIWELEAEAGSRFLLCSDGLTNEVADDEIADVLANAADPEQAGRELVGRALGHGGMDNVTVVVADVVEGDVDLAEVPVLVPPLPPHPEAPVVGTPELTGAVPVSAPAGMSDGTPPSPVATSELVETSPSEPVRRKGRSMTAPQARIPPAIPGLIESGLVGAGAVSAAGFEGTGQGPQPESGFVVGGETTHTRPVVLVRRKRDRAPRDRIVTIRVVVFVLILVALAGGTAGVVVWFNQSRYFLGLSGDSVAIYQGAPGGMLWFKPQLIELSPITTSDLLPSTIATLRDGISESSLTAAEHVASLLKNEKANALAAVRPTTTTTTSTTSTTTTTTFAGTFPPATMPPTSAPPTTRPPSTTQPKKPPPTTLATKSQPPPPPTTSATTTPTTTAPTTTDTPNTG